jgi:predicted helicase
MREPKQAPILPELTKEGQDAKKVKEKIPILVVLGNPPYSVSSENKSDFIEKLMEDYKKDVRKEKNLQPLSDDYIKFIRFAHWKIAQTGKGIVGFISNNSYLSGVIHRGMRKELLETFDTIFILNLHGSSRIGEKTPEGGKDENVFDIQQGVAIAIYVKLEKTLKEKKVYYADVWGLRDVKYNYLRRNDVASTDWQELQPKEPYYFFVPKDFALQEEYDRFWKVPDIFPVKNVGIATSRDNFVVDFIRGNLFRRINMFRELSISDDTIRQNFNLNDKKGWKLKRAREVLSYDQDWEKAFYRCLYRPFDIRWIYYHDSLIERSRKEVMCHMMQENFGLLLTRTQSSKPGFSIGVGVSREMVDQCVVGNKSAGSGMSYVFPLYCYSNQSKLCDVESPKAERTPNFDYKFLHSINNALGTEPTPEEIFYYIYAVLYSPMYRKRYEEFLKIDFPRVPLPVNYELFKNLCELGKQLVELHLLKHPTLSKTSLGFPESGTNEVEKIKYAEETERVYFNKKQYFEGISKEVWEYQIGGYQVLDKYLKDRKGRELTKEEIEHYMKVVKAIERTIEVQKEIDEVLGDEF